MSGIAGEPTAPTTPSTGSDSPSVPATSQQARPPDPTLPQEPSELTDEELIQQIANEETETPEPYSRLSNLDQQGEQQQGEQQPGEQQETEQEPQESQEATSAPAGVHQEARAALDAGNVDRAIELALGVTAESLKINSSDYVKHRRHVQKAQAKLAQREQEQNLKIQQISQAIRPALGLNAALQQYTRDGDPSGLVAAITATTGEDYSVFQQRVLRGEKGVPGGRASSVLLQQMQAMQQEIQRLKNPPAQQETHEQRASRIQQQRVQLDAHIQREAQGHPAMRLPNGLDLVRQTYLASVDKTLGAPSISLRQAADRVHQAAVAQAKALGFSQHQAAAAPASPSAAAPAAAPAAPPSSGVSIPRQANAESSDSVDEDSIEYILAAVDADAKRLGIG